MRKPILEVRSMPGPEHMGRSGERKVLSKLFSFMIGVGVLLTILGILSVIKIVPYRVYTNPAYRIEAKFPDYWAYVNRTEPGAVVAFITPPSGASDNFTENVVITCEETGGEIANLGQLTRTMIKQLTGTFEGYIKVVGSGETSMGNRPAYKFVYNGEVEGVTDAYQYMHVWTLVGTRAYILTYIAKTSTFKQYLKEVNNIIRSIKIEEP